MTHEPCEFRRQWLRPAMTMSRSAKRAVAERQTSRLGNSYRSSTPEIPDGADCRFLVLTAGGSPV